MRIQVGTIGRPFGFRGEFFLAHRSGSEPLSADIQTLYVGKEADSLKPYNVQSLRSVNNGVRVKLEGLEADVEVKAHGGLKVYADQEALPPVGEGEFRVADLLGFNVIEDSSERPIGVISEVETVGRGCADRWWITKPDGSEFAIPAVEEIVLQVDVAARKMWIDNETGLDAI